MAKAISNFNIDTFIVILFEIKCAYVSMSVECASIRMYVFVQVKHLYTMMTL